MYQNAYLPAVGENGGVHRVSGYRMGYAVDGVTPSTGSGQHGGRLPIDVGGKDTGKSKVYAGNDMIALACGSSNQGVWFFSSAEPLLLVDGVKSLLRGQIIDDGLTYLEEGAIPPFALETMEHQNDAYVRLGDGDKSVNDIVDRCRRLPIRSGHEHE